MKLTEGRMDEAIRNAYLWGHNHCTYGPTDRSYPVGDDGIMDCAGLVLRALYTLGLVSRPLNIDQLDAIFFVRAIPWPSFRFLPRNGEPQNDARKGALKRPESGSIL